MKDKSIVVLAAPGFEEVELVAPVDILRRLGVKVTLAGLEGLTVKGAHDITLRADMLLVDVVAAEFDGVMLPGGPAAWTLRDTPAVLALVREMHREGKLVSAICAAPIALEAAGVLKGLGVTCYPADDVVNAITSAKKICETKVAVDGHVITGRGPAAALDFGYALGEYLCGADKVTALKKEMCYKESAV